MFPVAAVAHEGTSVYAVGMGRARGSDMLPASHSDISSVLDRAHGAYLGLAMGDALGATVEFMTAQEIRAEYGVHRTITGGGWLRLRSGQVTDDTQMCLAVGRAVLARADWDVRLVAESLLAWMRSCPTDIGHTCRRGLRRFSLDGTLSAEPALDNGGNGAAVRNLPVSLATLGNDEALTRWSIEQAHITHHHPFSDAATVMFGRLVHRLVVGDSRSACREMADTFVSANPIFRFDPWPGNSSGYIVDTTQTALEAFFATDTFEDCLVRAVNRGGDTDTIGALAGQLAGACYGVQSIPASWLRRLDANAQAQIREQATALIELALNRYGGNLARLPDASGQRGMHAVDNPWASLAEGSGAGRLPQHRPV
jgi:ADP-ribosyl-[dinitrogen reductase] hydrolase